MRIGVMVGATDGAGDSLDEVLATIKQLDDSGFDDVWVANVFGLDAITTLAIAARETKQIGLGTAVVPTYPRHPHAMAQQALTTNVASNGRLCLGIGLSHKMVIEDMFGMSYDKPARHMREYLQVLMPLLRGEKAEHAGEVYSVNASLNVLDSTPPTTLIAALGPIMLKIAGQLADGTTTWVTGPVTIEQHIIPGIRAAAVDAGRPEPKICCGLPIILTDDAEGAKALIAKDLAIYGMLPSYRAMLDREGVAGPEDVALVGNEKELRQQIQRLRDIGVTHLNAAAVDYNGNWQNTIDFLKSEL